MAVARRLPHAVAVAALTAACNGAPIAADAAAAPSVAAPVSPAAAGPVVRELPRRPDDFTLAGELTQGGWIRGRAPADSVSVTLNGAPLQIAPDGAFFAAFDRDAGADARLVARLADGRTVAHPLAISPRGWNIEHVAVGPRPGAVPSAEYVRRRAIETARINAARARQNDTQGWRQSFVWPVTGRLSGLFGSQRIYRGTPGAYHSGMDIATGASGTPFVAPADGVVILAAESPFTLEGNLLMIDHGMGLNSAFLHCSQILVREGEAVRQGQVIGRIGMTGRATGPHLHWSIKWRSYRLDPLLFTGPMR